MLVGLLLYLRDEAWPRRFRIISSFPILASAAIAFVISLTRASANLGPVTFGNMAAGLLAYAAVSFGFAIAAFSLILAIPHREFAQWLATSAHKDNRSAYSNLLFVFSWTAFLHWLLVVTMLVLIVLYGTDAVAFPVNSDRRIASVVLSFITSASLFQFLSSLFSLSQFGRLYVEYLHHDGGRK